jgi:hypothetical protein
MSVSGVSSTSQTHAARQPAAAASPPPPKASGGNPAGKGSAGSAGKLNVHA